MGSQHHSTATAATAAVAENSTPSTQEPHPPPPSYTPSDTTTTNPPTYQSVQTALSSLSQGDPNETISVPMISRTLQHSIHNYNPFSRKQGTVRQSVITRQMKRSQYLAHYAKDSEGNFIGTGREAPDAGLVFVPSKGSSEDMLRQAEEVALRVQRLRGDGIGEWGKPLPDNYVGMTGGGGM